MESLYCMAKLANQESNVTEWDRYLDADLLAIRKMFSESTGHSSAELLYDDDFRTLDI
jgi:hypothetical protein